MSSFYPHSSWIIWLGIELQVRKHCPFRTQNFSILFWQRGWGSGNLFLRTLHLDGEPTFLLFLLFFFLCLPLLLFLLLAVGGGGKLYIVRFSSYRAIRKHTTVFLSQNCIYKAENFGSYAFCCVELLLQKDHTYIMQIKGTLAG